MKEKTFAEKAYKHTALDASYTEKKINEMLEQLGISQMRMTRDGDDYVFEFIVNLYAGQPGRKVRINLPIGDIAAKTERGREREKNAMFRVLYYNLKNRFVTVTNGLKEFDSEFLADLVVVHNGKEMRVADIILPEIKKQFADSGEVTLRIDREHHATEGV